MNDFVMALEELQREKGIDKEVVYEALEASLVSACRKNFGTSQNIKVDLNRKDGTVKVWAQKNVVDVPQDDNLEISLEKAQQIYLKYGITTVQDGSTNASGFQKLAECAKEQVFHLDVVSYVLADDLEKTAEEYPEYYQKYHNRLKIGGAKIILDGSPQGRSAWLRKPYEGEETYCGYPAHTQEETDRWVETAVEKGYQLLAHCNGDAASGQYLAAFEKAAAKTPENPEKIRALRPVMIHCQTVGDDQLDEMKELGMIPSIFVAHTWYWGDVHLKNLGSVRGAHISPARAAMERGLIYNFHQDTPVVEPDMLHTVWCAVNRVTRSGKPIGQEQCIGVYEALKGVTIHGAYAYHEEERKGTLEAGKLADMVILDRNPLKTDKMQIRDIQVLETIKEGKTLYILRPAEKKNE